MSTGARRESQKSRVLTRWTRQVARTGSWRSSPTRKCWRRSFGTSSSRRRSPCSRPRARHRKTSLRGRDRTVAPTTPWIAPLRQLPMDASAKVRPPHREMLASLHRRQRHAYDDPLHQQLPRLVILATTSPRAFHLSYHARRGVTGTRSVLQRHSRLQRRAHEHRYGL